MKKQRCFSVISRCLAIIACGLFFVNNVVLAACGELQTVTSQIDQGDADEVRTEIEMGAGELVIMNGAESLMNAEFTFNVNKFEPTVEYDVTDSMGLLSVKPSFKLRFGDLRGCLQPKNKWDIKLNNEVPMDLHVELGAGDAILNLSDLTLTNLDVEIGAGDVDIDISGNDSINSFDVEVGVGDVVINLSNTSLVAFDLEFGAGDLDIDFTGDRENDLMASLEVGVGDVDLELPTDIGVKVVPMRGIVPVNAPDFRRDGNAFINGAFGQADVNIVIEIEMGVGGITLESKE